MGFLVFSRHAHRPRPLVSALPAGVPVVEREPVAILERHELPEREAIIEAIERRERRVDVTLTLDDASPAKACLEPDEVAWLELRVGDIVWVRALSALPRCDAAPTVLSLSA
jgi:hypothetical protein